MGISAFLLLALGLASSWPQWGGPTRDFHSDATGLADKWPAAGPKPLWKRDLGDGYSAIVTDDRALYTMYRRGTQNIVIALDAQSGRTLWEQAFEAKASDKALVDYGTGPNATPLLAAGRLFVTTYNGTLAALDAATGKLLWKHELWSELHGTFNERGYASSPIAYHDQAVVPVGGKGQGLIAFRQSDGKIVWRNSDLENALSSPILINVDGEEQFAILMLKEAAGVDAKTGELRWRHPHQTMYDINVTTPVWAPGNILLFSSAYDGGTRAVQLKREGGKTAVKELWFSKRLRVHHGNMLLLGGYLYASSGDFGVSPVTCIDVKTGEIKWQQRQLAKANYLFADGKGIALDEDGKLALLKLTPEKLEVLSTAQVLEKIAWTVPTLSGTHLYIRDQKMIRALDLGR